MSLSRFRRAYGSSPLHLLALVASLGVAGYVAIAWLQVGAGGVVRFFVLALIAHDLVLLPLYTMLDWIAFGGERGRARAARALVNPVPYFRVPALLSGILLLAFGPEVLSFGAQTYRTYTGQPEANYLARWLAATGVMFALSGLTYAVALRRARTRS